MKELDLRPEATWRKRFRAVNILWAVLAEQNPSHGLVCTDKDGIYQLYAWDVATGELRQITQQPAGVVGGSISSDGDSIFFLKDQDGNEIGHFVSVPFAGGEAEDISPELPPYSSFSVTQSRKGNVTGFRAAAQNKFKYYQKFGDEAPTLIYESDSISFGPAFSCDGKMAVIGSSERTKSLDFSLLAIDTQSGKHINEIWEEGASIDNPIFSPVEGDPRLICTSSQSSFERPLLWNVVTGECIPLQMDDVPGTVLPQAWSEDA